MHDAIEQTRHIYGARLLVRGLLWISVFFLLRGVLELEIGTSTSRALIALLPTPFFACTLWTWMKGVSQMDELQRRIELEALGFAFPSALLILATLGLLDVAVTLNAADFSVRNTWLIMPILYYIGLLLREAALSVKNRLKVLRAERNWSQQDLANRAGRVSPDRQRDRDGEGTTRACHWRCKVGRLFARCPSKRFSRSTISQSNVHSVSSRSLPRHCG